MISQLKGIQKYFRAGPARFVSIPGFVISLAALVCSCSRSTPLISATSAAPFTPVNTATASSTLTQAVPSLAVPTSIPTLLETTPAVITNPFAALKTGQYLFYEMYPASLVRDKRILGVISFDGSQVVEQSLPPAWIDSDLNFSPDRKHPGV